MVVEVQEYLIGSCCFGTGPVAFVGIVGEASVLAVVVVAVGFLEVVAFVVVMDPRLRRCCVVSPDGGWVVLLVPLGIGCRRQLLGIVVSSDDGRCFRW